MDVFRECQSINECLLSGADSDARDQLIRLLAHLEAKGEEYSPLVNRLIREVGLFPYLQPETSSWEERFVVEAFKADVGGGVFETLHREQSRLLYALLAGRSVAVSAPTSFGKSFVIDAFIAIRQPAHVVILVPTIALADETRRRLQKKFGHEYKLITTVEQSISDRNIFVFPQERAARYASVLDRIDLLIVDEFYKASREFDRERSPALIRAIVNLSNIAAQRYFLAPNIDSLKNNPFTDGMEFLHLDFNTVVLDKTDLSGEIGSDQQKKSAALLGILSNSPGKTLIYAGTYANISRLATLLMTELNSADSRLLRDFETWLAEHYDPNWNLTKLVHKGVGIHNGRLHRSLSQIQIKLFEEDDGLRRVVSTSSIIEGVNTSAESVVLWSNRNGAARINDFTYKNIIGRGGRMFRHFIGRIFILEEPPSDEDIQLTLEFPDELLGTFDDESVDLGLSSDQKAAIEKYNSEMRTLVGDDNFEYFRDSDPFQSSSSTLIMRIAQEIANNKREWRGLGNLNSPDPNRWRHYLFKLLNLQPGGWGARYSQFVSFVQTLSENWKTSIPDLLTAMAEFDISIEQFFELERNLTFKLSALLGDVFTIYNRLTPEQGLDLTPAISRFSHAFLPSIVYQLEEYGIPRMISRKIHQSGLLDLESASEIHEVLQEFRAVGLETVLTTVDGLDSFDVYILQYFYSGIETENGSN